jgi:hypothetical protein
VSDRVWRFYFSCGWADGAPAELAGRATFGPAGLPRGLSGGQSLRAVLRALERENIVTVAWSFFSPLARGAAGERAPAVGRQEAATLEEAVMRFAEASGSGRRGVAGEEVLCDWAVLRCERHRG